MYPLLEDAYWQKQIKDAEEYIASGDKISAEYNYKKAFSEAIWLLKYHARNEDEPRVAQSIAMARQSVEVYEVCAGKDAARELFELLAAELDWIELLYPVTSLHIETDLRPEGETRTISSGVARLLSITQQLWSVEFSDGRYSEQTA